MTLAIDEFITDYPAIDLDQREARIEHCMMFWRSIPADCRVSSMIDVLEHYRDSQQDCEALFSNLDIAQSKATIALNELITAAYRLASGKEGHRLQMRPNEAQSLTILRVAFHTCGHGDDTRPPLDFALRHFQKKLYAPAFFDALSRYRECLSRTKHTATQMLKTEIDLILWQDLRNPELPGRSCWSGTIRRGLSELSEDEQPLWRALFQGFHCGMASSPPKQWTQRVEPALTALGGARFGNRVRSWVGPTTSEPLELTAAGSYILKNLIWVAALVRDMRLDDVLHATLFQPWRRRQPLDKVAVALAYLWSRPGAHHNRDVALRRLTELVKEYGLSGQIEKLRQSYVVQIR